MIEVLADTPFTSAAVATIGRGQLAGNLAQRGPVTLFGLDLWQTRRAAEWLAGGSATPAVPVQVLCQADWPAGPFDLAAVPLPQDGAEELALDLLESAWRSLRPGGRMFASVVPAAGAWLQRHLSHFSRSVSVRKVTTGVVGSVVVDRPLTRLRNWACQFAFRDRGQLIQAVSRPGVFSHRRLDNGARQLLNSVEVEPGSRVLDIGCGCGAVALGFARRDPANQVVAVDSNARAVECTRRGAELNGLENIEVVHAEGTDYGPIGEMDLALGNPPYFSGYRIAEVFCLAALRNLRPGGRVVLVSRTPDWYREHLPQWFESVEIHPSGRYHLATGIKPD